MCNFVEATPFCLEVHRAVKPRALRAFFRLFTFLSSLAPLSVTLKKKILVLYVLGKAQVNRPTGRQYLPSNRVEY